MKEDIVISSLVEWMYWMFWMVLVSNRFLCCDVVAGFGYLSLKLLALDLVSWEYRRQKKDLWLNVCLYWAEKLMNVNCNNLLNTSKKGFYRLTFFYHVPKYSMTFSDISSAKIVITFNRSWQNSIRFCKILWSHAIVLSTSFSKLEHVMCNYHLTPELIFIHQIHDLFYM